METGTRRLHTSTMNAPFNSKTREEYAHFCDLYQRRLDALTLIKQLIHMIKAVQRHRGMTMGMLGGNLSFRDELANASDPDAERARLTHEYEERFANPYIAASRGYVDDVIEPRDTRPRVIAALEMLDGKRQSNLPRKHGNIPL